MIEDLLREEMLTRLDAVVAELLQAAGIDRPPVDAIQLAQRHLGMEVCLDKRQANRGRAQRSGGREQIYLRPEPSKERHQWTVAHEIGEHLKPQLLQCLGLEPDETRPMMGESLANLFANHLLVPSCWFASDAVQLAHDVLDLKNRYGTASHEVIALRMLDLPEPAIITIVDNEKIHRRRSNYLRVRKALEPVEQECQRHVHRTSQPTIRNAGAWSVQGWPVHQSEWKREILRSVVEMDVL